MVGHQLSILLLQHCSLVNLNHTLDLTLLTPGLVYYSFRFYCNFTQRTICRKITAVFQGVIEPSISRKFLEEVNIVTKYLSGDTVSLPVREAVRIVVVWHYHSQILTYQELDPSHLFKLLSKRCMCLVSLCNESVCNI